MENRTNNDVGQALSLWLGQASAAAVAKQIAKDIAYNDAPFFGAEKRKVKLMGELVMVNSAIAISGVNHVYDAAAAKEIIDAFLAKSRTHIFSFLEARYPDFAGAYEKRMVQYFPLLAGNQPGIGLAFGFLKHMGKDPLASLPVQMSLGLRFGGSLKDVVETLTQSRPRPKPQQTGEGAAATAQGVPGLGSFMAEVNKWPDHEAQLTALRIVDAAISGKGASVSHLLEELTVGQMRVVMAFLEAMDGAPAK